MSTEGSRTYFTFAANASAGIVLLVYTYIYFFNSTCLASSGSRGRE
jgi:hypothetical protein